MRRAFLCFLTLAIFALPSALWASAFDIYGVGSRSPAMGNAQGAWSFGSEAVYYNPSLLATMDVFHIDTSVQGFLPFYEIKVNREYPNLEPRYGGTFGIALPFSFWGQKLGLGALVYLPLGSTTEMDALDPATPQNYTYQHLPQALGIGLGSAWKVCEWLSIGVGLQILAYFQGHLYIDLSLEHQRIEERSIDGVLKGEWAPTFGIWIQPWEPLTLGLTYRDDYGLTIDLPIDLYVDRVGLLAIQSHGVGAYSPSQFNVGLSYLWNQVRISGDLTYMRWSQAPSPAMSISAILDDSGIKSESDQVETILDLQSVEVPLGARDIWVPHVGMLWDIEAHWAFSMGYSYRPSPIPNQVGYSNYADENAHIGSIGLSWKSDPWITLKKQGIRLNFALQWTHLVERSVLKDVAQDVEQLGSWSSGGEILQLAMGMSFSY